MRVAVITVAPQMLRDLGPLFDAGIEVRRSLESLDAHSAVVFVIQGDALPEECEPGLDALREVSVEFTTEAYGQQRIVRVSAIKLTGRNVFDVALVPLRSAA